MGAIVGTLSLAAPILTPLLYVKMLPRYRKGLLILLGRVTTLGPESRSIKNIRGKNSPSIKRGRLFPKAPAIYLTSAFVLGKNNYEMQSPERLPRDVTGVTICGSNDNATAK